MIKNVKGKKYKKILSMEPFIFIVLTTTFFGFISYKMGTINLLNTLMNTSYALLTDTVWYLLAVMVLTGAIAALLSEFGVVAIINRFFSPLMYPLYGMPGASLIGILTTFLSDNSSILTLAKDDKFIHCFKSYQVPALANIPFGMGLIIITFMIGLGGKTDNNFTFPVLIGLFSAFLGSIFTTRLMLLSSLKVYKGTNKTISTQPDVDIMCLREIKDGSIFKRFMTSMLDGGKAGVTAGIEIIPGVLIICSVVMLLTNDSPSDTYTGAAYEGIAFLPWIAEKLDFIIHPLFGFTYDGAIAVPITAMGSAGASLSLIPEMITAEYIGSNEIAVFTAICMRWSGYLSTHISILDSLNNSQFTGISIFYHTLGGILSGICAHFIYMLIFENPLI